MSNKAFHSNNDFSHDTYVQHYEKQIFYGYESELSFLDLFLKKKKEEKKAEVEVKYSDHYGNDNFPLIITGDEGCGKTSLVVQWLNKMNKNQALRNNHVIITHFAGVSNCDLKYQSFIFRTLVKLRQEYDIQHRVEIIDDKLRMNFSRWLEIASQKHEERLDPNSKIILILDGLENFHDVDTQGEESADWIPWTFPNHIKVIIMTRKNSKAMNHFKLRSYPILYMDQFFEKEVIQMIDDYVSKDLRNQISRRQLEIVKSEFMKKKANFDKDPEVEVTTNEAFNPILERVNKSSMANEGGVKSLSTNFAIQHSIQAAMKFLFRKNYLKNIIQQADKCPKVSQPMEKLSNPLIIQCVLNFFLLYNKYDNDPEMLGIPSLEIAKIMEVKTMKQLFKIALNHFRTHIFGLGPAEQQKFDHIIGYIYVSRKGIAEQELYELIPNLTKAQFDRFQSIFGFLLVYEKEQIFIKHASFKKAIKECIQVINNPDQKVILHRNLANVIEKEEFSLRQVDELSHQYYMGKCWIKLKDLISNIEVFSIMFVPEIKHELATYWQCLEQHKYDPVAEYNKALEGFVVKYRPNNQELFVILIQLSRFFKELADLETKYTPQFKHPPLRGQSELESITLLGELQKLDDIYNPNTNVTVASEPFLGEVEHFNVDNNIVREQIMNKIRKELEEQKIEKSKESLQSKEEKSIYYYYKRWIWVQFPWCTIDVYSNLSNIMEMSMGSHTNYISTAKENELVNGTIQILKEAKLRKKNRLPNSIQANSPRRSLKNSRSKSPNIHKSSSASKVMERRTQVQQKAPNMTVNLSSINHGGSGALPPIPQSTKNNKGTQGFESRFQKQSKGGMIKHSPSKSLNAGDYRSPSLETGGPNYQRKNVNERNLLTLDLDSEDRKSPEKMLLKLTDKINEIEKMELLHLEQQNVGLGSDLNTITFQILRKEKELTYLEELYDSLQSEESLNHYEKIKLEQTEAKLLRAYENLNRVEVEKKRLEQIFNVCNRNPAKNQEWIRNLESQVESMRKLFRYQEQQIDLYKTEVEDSQKQINEMLSQMEEKKKLRDIAIMKVSRIIDKKRQLDEKVAEVEEQRKQILKGMDGPEKTINKLKQRQIVYRKWIAKLQVTKAFVNEKRDFYEKSFRKITAVTGISNPNDIEGLLGFIERTNDLRKAKQLRELKIEKMKEEKALLEDDLRILQNGQPQYDYTHFEMASNKLQEESKKLRNLKALEQRALCKIADLKSGIVNIAKNIGLKGQEIDDHNLMPYINKICVQYERIQTKVASGNIDFNDRIIEDNDDLLPSEREGKQSISAADGWKTPLIIKNLGHDDYSNISPTAPNHSSIIGQSHKAANEDIYLSLQSEDKKLSILQKQPSAKTFIAQTPQRARKQRQPKQRLAQSGERISDGNMNGGSNGIINSVGQQIQQFIHYSEDRHDVDSEGEEREQLKMDRIKVKQLFLGEPKTSGGGIGSGKHRLSRNATIEHSQSGSHSGIVSRANSINGGGGERYTNTNSIDANFKTKIISMSNSQSKGLKNSEAQGNHKLYSQSQLLGSSSQFKGNTSIINHKENSASKSKLLNVSTIQTKAKVQTLQPAKKKPLKIVKVDKKPLQQVL